jgi:hypothetical protein
MVCTWYNKVLWVPVLNKSAIGEAFGSGPGDVAAGEALRLVCG